MSKKVVILFADGLEECEGLICVDLLRRAGLDVTIASISDRREVTTSHKVTVIADALASDLEPADYDLCIVPGGLKGVNNLKASPLTTKFVTYFSTQEGKEMAAICAGPSVLGVLGLLKGQKATCYPGFEDQLEGAEFVKEPVVESGRFVTANGLGAAIPFALTLIKRLVSKDEADEVKSRIQYPFYY